MNWCVNYENVKIFLLGGLLSGALFGLGVISVHKIDREDDRNDSLLAGLMERDGLIGTATTVVPTPTFTPSPTPIPTPTPLPSSFQLGVGKHIFQSFNNCGPAAMSMALSLMGRSVGQVELGKQLRPYQNAVGDNDDKSVTLRELAALGNKYGYQAVNRPAGNMEIVKRLLNMGLPVVVRTWLKPREDIGHYRVITGYNDTSGVVVQDDSLQGRNLSYAYDEFDDLWRAFNYEFLVFYEEDQQNEIERILGDVYDLDVAWDKALQMSEQEIERGGSVYAKFNKVSALYYLERYGEARDLFEEIEGELPFRMLWYQIEPLLVYYQLSEDEELLRRIDAILQRENRAFSELYYLKGLVYEGQEKNLLAAEQFRLADKYNHADGVWLENLEDLRVEQ